MLEGVNFMKKLLVAALAGLSLAMSFSAASAADDKKVVIAYQTGAGALYRRHRQWRVSPRRPAGTSSSAASIPAPTSSPPSPPATSRSAMSAPARSPLPSAAAST